MNATTKTNVMPSMSTKAFAARFAASVCQIEDHQSQAAQTLTQWVREHVLPGATPENDFMALEAVALFFRTAFPHGVNVSRIPAIKSAARQSCNILSAILECSITFRSGKKEINGNSYPFLAWGPRKTKQEPKKEPEQEPKKEPEQEPEQEPKKEPEQEPEQQDQVPEIVDYEKIIEYISQCNNLETLNKISKMVTVRRASLKALLAAQAA